MKTNMLKQVEHKDAEKKVNPLDLSSDQDLTIALMNLILIEEKSNGEMFNIVHDMRRKLMARVVTDDKTWAVSKHLLGNAMHLINQGNKLSESDCDSAYANFNRAYEMYSLFLGVNMGLVNMSDVQMSVPDVWDTAKKDTECR